MVVLSNPGTYVHGNAVPAMQISTSLRIQNTSIQKSNIPKIPKSKTPKIFGFWVLGFLCFALVFPICRNSSKIGFGKNGVCIGIYSVFWVVRVVGGGDHIYIHTEVLYTYICKYNLELPCRRMPVTCRDLQQLRHTSLSMLSALMILSTEHRNPILQGTPTASLLRHSL